MSPSTKAVSASTEGCQGKVVTKYQGSVSEYRRSLGEAATKLLGKDVAKYQSRDASKCQRFPGEAVAKVLGKAISRFIGRTVTKDVEEVATRFRGEAVTNLFKAGWTVIGTRPNLCFGRLEKLTRFSQAKIRDVIAADMNYVDGKELTEVMKMKTC